MRQFKFGLAILLLATDMSIPGKDLINNQIDVVTSLDFQNRKDGIFAEFNTNKGKIVVRLDYTKAPMTVANFIGLTEGTLTNATYSLGNPFFNGSIWHRVVKGHVIQGGEPSTVKDPANSDVNSTGYMIPNEISDLSHNKAGMIGMANAGPHTNTCEYYITLGDRSYLDGNYTLFGEVLDGMDVVDKITRGDTTFSISIIRAGEDAEKFIVNDETFKKLVDRQWRKVKYEEEIKKAKDEKYINDNYPDLVKTSSGLRYRILTEGRGDSPLAGSSSVMMYSGKLTSGLTFASTADAGKPASNAKPVSFVYTYDNKTIIRGLHESVMDMKSGEKRLIVIPPELAYGQSAFYGKETPGQKRFVISPGEILILELALISFK